MLLFRHSLSRANIALFLSLVCVAALANSASATVTIIAAQRIVTVLQTGGGQDSDNSFAASGAFTETASVEVLPTGSNNFGSLFAEQDTTINALSWGGTGGVAIDGHYQDDAAPGFGGSGVSFFTVVFELTCPTRFLFEGLLTESTVGGDAQSLFLLNGSGVGVVFEAYSASGGPVPVVESGLLAPGVYVFGTEARATGTAGLNFFDRAGFDFDFQLEEQCIVPEPASVAVWSLIGLTFVGANSWRRRRAQIG